MKKEEIINALIKIFKAGISFEYIGDFYCKFRYIGLLFKVNYEHISVERYVDQYTLGSSEFTSHIEKSIKKYGTMITDNYFLSEKFKKDQEMSHKLCDEYIMRLKLKDGRILPIEKGSLIALDDRGETLEVNVEDVDSVITDGINWEQRRYEIAKEMLHAIYIDDGNAERDDDSDLNFEFKSLQGSAREAVRFADALIEELKKAK